MKGWKTLIINVLLQILIFIHRHGWNRATFIKFNGKNTLIHHIVSYFENRKKLYLWQCGVFCYLKLIWVFWIAFYFNLIYMFRKSALFVSWLFLCYIYSITFIFWQIFPDSEMRANREWNPDKKETTVWWMGIHALICVYVRFCQRLCLKSTRINFGNACLYRLSTFCKTLKKERVFVLSLPFCKG